MYTSKYKLTNTITHNYLFTMSNYYDNLVAMSQGRQPETKVIQSSIVYQTLPQRVVQQPQQTIYVQPQQPQQPQQPVYVQERQPYVFVQQGNFQQLPPMFLRPPMSYHPLSPW